MLANGVLLPANEKLLPDLPGNVSSSKYVDQKCAEIVEAVEKLSSEEKVAYIKTLIGLIDLTALAGDDTPSRAEALVDKAIKPSSQYPDLSCAAVCVYPARIPNVISRLKFLNEDHKIRIASVAGGFPSGQYKLPSRLLEIQLAIEDGANEIDTVISRSLALTGEWAAVYDELIQMKQLCGTKAILKTILATGELITAENIYYASWVAMLAGSDFIKTSTGKETVNATIQSTFIMCQAIKKFQDETGRKVGFKPAGGIKTAEQALQYALLVESILGEEWLQPNLFRIGASSLLDDLCHKLHEYS